MSADVERIGREHVASSSLWIRRESATSAGLVAGCRVCGQAFPCDAVRLLDDNAALRARADAAEARAYLLVDALDDYSRVSAIDLGEALRGLFRGETIEPRATESEARALRDALLPVPSPGADLPRASSEILERLIEMLEESQLDLTDAALVKRLRYLALILDENLRAITWVS